MQVFFNLFSDVKDICEHFIISESELEGAEIIYACYEHEDYAGQADVIFFQHGKLWIVCGSHCSCNGLEEQWKPEETSVHALLMMKNDQLKGAVKEYFKDLLVFV